MSKSNHIGLVAAILGAHLLSAGHFASAQTLEDAEHRSGAMQRLASKIPHSHQWLATVARDARDEASVSDIVALTIHSGREAKRQNPKDAASLLNAVALAKQFVGDFLGAVELFEEVVDLDTKDAEHADALRFLGQINLYNRGDQRSAASAYQNLANLARAHASSVPIFFRMEALEKLAYIQRTQNNAESAIEARKELLRIEEGLLSADRRAIALLEQARDYQRLGLTDESSRQYALAVDAFMRADLHDLAILTRFENLSKVHDRSSGEYLLGLQTIIKQSDDQLLPAVITLRIEELSLMIRASDVNAKWHAHILAAYVERAEPQILASQYLDGAATLQSARSIFKHLGVTLP